MNRHPGIDESDLLAWVEGTIAPDRRAAVQAAIDGDATLARILEAMSADRAALASFVHERAPADLIDRVQVVMERSALVGITDGAPQQDHPPISIVTPVRRSPWDILVRDRAGRSLALAAGVLIVAGSAAFIGARMLGGSPTRPSGPIAMDGRGAREAPAEVAEPPVDAALATAPVEESGVQDAAATLALDAPAATAMTPERALELLRAGRLAIRLTTGDAAGTREKFDSMAARGASRRSQWRWQPDAPDALVAMVRGPRPVVTVALDIPRPEAPAVTGSEQPLAREIDPLLPDPPLQIELPPPGGVYIVAVRQEQSAIDDFTGSLGEACELVELPAPIPQTGDAPPIDPDQIFWWTRPPSNWTPWARVVVIVDQRPQ